MTVFLKYIKRNKFLFSADIIMILLLIILLQKSYFHNFITQGIIFILLNYNIFFCYIITSPVKLYYNSDDFKIHKVVLENREKFTIIDNNSSTIYTPNNLFEKSYIKQIVVIQEEKVTLIETSIWGYLKYFV